VDIRLRDISISFDTAMWKGSKKTQHRVKKPMKTVRFSNKTECCPDETQGKGNVVQELNDNILVDGEFIQDDHTPNNGNNNNNAPDGSAGEQPCRQEEPGPSQQDVRRSQRARKVPERFKDYYQH